MQVLSKGGYEANKILKFFMDRFGIAPTLIITKGLVVVFVLIGAIEEWFARNDFLFIALIGLFLLYAWIVWNNWCVYKKVR